MFKLTSFFEVLILSYGLIAQLVEQLTLNQLVVGSSPTEPKSIFKEGFNPLFLCKILIKNTLKVQIKVHLFSKLFF